MGRLAGFKYSEAIKKLRGFGFAFHRHAAGSHEIWYNPQTNRYTTIPNHPGDLPEGRYCAPFSDKPISIPTNF